MKESKLINYLKSLRHLEPDQGWFSSNKKDLQEFIKENPVLVKPKSFSYFFFLRNFRFASAIVAVILVLGLGSGAVLASQDTLPGETLFPVKLLTEEVEKFLARDDFSKAEISIKLTNKRLEEVIKLTSSNNPEENQEHINKNLERFKTELKTAEGFLFKLDIKNKKDKKTLKLALKFGESLTNYQELLEEIEDLFPNQLKKVIQLAREASGKGEETSFKIALKLKIEIEEEVDGEEEGDADGKEGKKLEIMTKIKEKAQEEISDAEEKLSDAKEKAEELVEIPKAARKLLDRAEDHLTKTIEAFDEEKYGKAFGQARATERLAKNAERIIDRQEEIDEDDTTPTPDITAPVISDLSIINTTTSSTMVVWNTNEPADSKVWYDTSSPLVITDTTPTESSSDLVLNHEISIFSLIPGTSYYYQVRSTDAVANTTTSAEQLFNTLP